MIRFVLDFVLFSLLLLLATVPLTLVARAGGRRKKPRPWHKAAVFLGFALAVLSWSSRDLTAKCVAARNEQCFDVGSAGMMMMFIGGFAGAALISAFLMYRDQ